MSAPFDAQRGAEHVEEKDDGDGALLAAGFGAWGADYTKNERNCAHHLGRHALAANSCDRVRFKMECRDQNWCVVEARCRIGEITDQGEDNWRETQIEVEVKDVKMLVNCEGVLATACPVR